MVSIGPHDKSLTDEEVDMRMEMEFLVVLIDSKQWKI